MERAGIFGLALLAVVVQTTWVPLLGGLGASPDLIFLMVVFFGMQRGTTLGLWTGFGLGLVQDAAGGGPLGLNALVLLAVAYLAGFMRTRLFKENLSAQLVMVMALTWFHQFLMFFWMNTLLEASFDIGDWLRRSLWMSVFHAVLGPFLFRWLSSWIRGDDVYRHLIAGNAKNRRLLTR